MQTFDRWWKNWSETIWEAGGLASPKQVKLIFKDCFLEGFEAGHRKCLSDQNIIGATKYNSGSEGIADT